MTNEEFMKIKTYKKGNAEILIAEDLINKENRTLLYGYTCDRETWHVSVSYTHLTLPTMATV